MGYIGQAPPAGGVTSSDINDGTITNDDIASDAAISMSKTALVDGTGVTLSTNTLSVDASQTQITALGTIGTGTWEATDIGVEHGGTGVSSFTDAGVLIGNGTGAVQSTSAGTSGQVLTSNGAGVDPTFQDAAGSFDFQTFTSSGTWTKPSGATMVMVELIGGGAGGKSGNKGASGTTRSAGFGGASSGVTYYVFAASELGSTETVTIGAGGTGGASVTTDSTNGTAGAAGGTSIFGSTALATCQGALSSAGSGASTSAFGYHWGHFGAGTNGKSGVKTGGGGAGGSIDTGNTENPGGDGGAPNVSYTNYTMTAITALAGASGGAVGANGSNATAGGGGGGGGGSHTGNAGAGGNGDTGGGGGGGGASTNGVGNSGAGGNGGDGRVRVWTW